MEMIETGTVPPMYCMVNLGCFHQYVDMEMQAGIPNKHICLIFFVLAAPMYCWKMVSCTNSNGAL